MLPNLPTNVIFLIAIIPLQAIHAANLSQRVMWAGEAAAHRVGTNQQKEIIPAD